MNVPQILQLSYVLYSEYANAIYVLWPNKKKKSVHLQSGLSQQGIVYWVANLQVDNVVSVLNLPEP